MASTKGRPLAAGAGAGCRWLKLLGIAAAPILLAGAALLGLSLSGQAPMTAGEMPHEAYIWQRVWQAPVKEAIAQAAPRVAGFTCLGAEVTIRNDRPSVVRAAVDWRSMASAGRPAGVALRIGPYRGPFIEEDSLSAYLSGQAAACLAEARAGGVEPTELQLDFDCSESDLDGYARWARAIRSRVAPVPVTITALPCWLKRPAFARLAAEAGDYVLQVHSLERPKGPDVQSSLCDLASARRAVERAGRIGVPFRVALPTYGYVIAFDRVGRFLGLSAEGPTAVWGPDVRLRELRADPAAMAELVHGWTASRPACMTGIIWYRLPVETDVLNWRWSTLAAVMAGRTPAPSLQVELRRPEPGLVEVVLANAGEADGPQDAAIKVRWDAGELLAADAIGGFDLGDRAGSALTFSSPGSPAGARLAPGRSLAIGWLRFSGEPKMSADVIR